jgi:hypothetical protein
MSINSKVATAALALGVVAMNAVSLAGSAEASPRWRGAHGAPVARHYAPPPVAYHKPRHHRGDHVGAGIALGVGALIVGSILASKAARAERQAVVRGDDAYQRCADDFRSFDWDSGTIVNRYGDRVTCPYLD